MKKLLIIFLVLLTCSSAIAANTSTTNYGFPKPASGDNGAAWIADFNGRLDTADAAIKTALDGKLPLAGGTIAGNLAFSGTGNWGLTHNPLTTTQRNALTNVPGGAVVWNSTTTRVNLCTDATPQSTPTWSPGWVRLDGDTMTGNLTANVSPTSATITTGSSIYPGSTGAVGGTKVQHFTITALNGTATFYSPQGSWNDGDLLTIRIKDDGNIRTLDFTTSPRYRNGTDVGKPTATVPNKTMYVQFCYNYPDDKWDLVATPGGF